jgi:translation initiation factor 1 (eIF-1/SUI1)
MNPFENDDKVITKTIGVEIWIETNGRKQNTFVSGWDISIEELKEHLKHIKQKNGCNGTIKNKLISDKNVQILQIQGNLLNYIYDYLQNNGVYKDSIVIKG